MADTLHRGAYEKQIINHHGKSELIVLIGRTDCTPPWIIGLVAYTVPTGALLANLAGVLTLGPGLGDEGY